MYIDVEDYRPDTPRVESALSMGTAVLIALTVHVLVIVTAIFAPSMSLFRAVPVSQFARSPSEPSQRFMFVQPLIDVPKPQPKPNVDASDQDRVASTRERPPDPQNAQPFTRGNSPEHVEADAAREQEDQRSAGQVASNDPAHSMVTLPEMPAAAPALQLGRTSPNASALGEALRNLQRYVQQQSFDNPQGSGDAQGLIQFDSKGVEFGPWLRRFIAQVKRNWYVPEAAMVMSLHGHVVITFNVSRQGAISEIDVKGPSDVESFNRSAVNALLSSNPTQPLPPEYPTDHVFFTVTFLYNEEPPANYR